VRDAAPKWCIHILLGIIVLGFAVVALAVGASWLEALYR
jgi:hypothetical protein